MSFTTPWPFQQPVYPSIVLDDSGAPQEVIDLFERLAWQLKNQGFQRYSARAILHRIRWHFRVDRGMREFKCNNNWTPKMARNLVKKYPEFDGFFEFRSSPGEDE